jgi:D-3-phosphoglycerate dehydrogenase
MAKPDILQLVRYAPFTQEELERHFTVHKLFEAADPDALIASLAHVRGVATGGEYKLGAEFFAKLPKLEIVSSFGVGYDGIDVAAASAAGVKVTNTPGVLSKEVADMTLAMILAWYRKVPEGDAYVRSGAWANGPMALQRRAYGRKCGIVGMGRIGQEIAKRCAAFDMELAYFARTEKSELSYRFEPDLTALARWADMLVVIIPGGKATEKIISREVIEALGPEGMLLNIARGSVVDEAALLDALENRRIAGAALDVFLNEPTPDPRFAKLDNVLLQPHVGSATVETRTDMGQLVVDNLREWLANGKTITPVN